MKVIIKKTGDNFLLSNTDLKNLGILSPNFPEYIGERRRAFVQSTQREEKLSNEECSYFASNVSNAESEPDKEEEITISQGESSVTVECPGDLSDKQITVAEAYASFYALGGYTYSNLAHEAPEEICNVVESGDEDEESESDGK